MPAADASAVQGTQPAVAQPVQQPALDPALEMPQDTSMGMETEEMPEGVDDSTMTLFAQLDPEQKETARKYIISMISQSEGEQEQQSMDITQQQPTVQPQQQMAESSLNEKIAPADRKEKEDEPQEVLPKHKNNKSPWGSPQFKK